MLPLSLRPCEPFLVCVVVITEPGVGSDRVVSEMLNYAAPTTVLRAPVHYYCRTGSGSDRVFPTCSTATLLRVDPVATLPVLYSRKETSMKAELAAARFAESSRSFRNPRKTRVRRA